ncbi:unnamed protein product [Sphagnum balticum]
MTANRVPDKLVASNSNRRTRVLPPTTRSDEPVAGGSAVENDVATELAHRRVSAAARQCLPLCIDALLAFDPTDPTQTAQPTIAQALADHINAVRGTAICEDDAMEQQQQSSVTSLSQLDEYQLDGDWPTMDLHAVYESIVHDANLHNTLQDTVLRPIAEQAQRDGDEQDTDGDAEDPQAQVRSHSSRSRNLHFQTQTTSMATAEAEKHTDVSLKCPSILWTEGFKSASAAQKKSTEAGTREFRAIGQSTARGSEQRRSVGIARDHSTAIADGGGGGDGTGDGDDAQCGRGRR